MTTRLFKTKVTETTNLVMKESPEELKLAHKHSGQCAHAASMGDYAKFDISKLDAIQHGYEVPSK
jgi:hypothetical protein